MIDLAIYAAIDSATARDVRERLSRAPREPVTIRVHSPGGSMFSALAIFSALQAHTGRVTAIVEGVAASAASVIVMAADDVAIVEHGYLLLHDPSATVDGTAADLAATAALLERTREQLLTIYAGRATIGREQLAGMMAAETWIDAQQAVQFGLANRIITGRRVAASWRAADYFDHPPSTLETSVMATPTAAEIRAACPGADADFILAQVEASATIDQARAEWLDQREADLTARERAAKTQPAGVDGLRDRAGSRHAAGSDCEPEEFVRLVDELVAQGRPRLDAVAAIGRRRPDLHHAFVASHNRPGRVQDLIAERFDQ